MKKLRILIFLGLLLLHTGYTPVKKTIPVRVKKRPFPRSKWTGYLSRLCYYTGLDYYILKAQADWESYGNPREKEWHKRRRAYISFGLYQVSPATAECYFRSTGVKPYTSNIRSYLYNYENNINIILWFYLRRFAAHGSYVRALSEHNLGETGYYRYAKSWRKLKNGKWVKFYKRYVYGIERELGRRIYK